MEDIEFNFSDMQSLCKIRDMINQDVENKLVAEDLVQKVINEVCNNFIIKTKGE